MAEKGFLIVVSGPAGSGKGTVLSHILGRDDFAYSVSATTRAPRPGEVHGKNYYYITKEDFEQRIANDAMLEYTQYCGNYYGTPRAEAEAVLASGKNLILEIETEGAMNIKKKFPEAILILLLPPSFEVQEARLRGRGTETEEKILLRLSRAKEEIKLAPSYDYVVYNYDGADAEAADSILSIVKAEHASIRRNPDIEEKYLARTAKN